MEISEIISKLDLSQMTTMLLALFKHWSTTPSEQLILLGLPENDIHLLECLHRGHSIPDDAGTLMRAEHLLTIHAMLRGLFPRNLDLVHDWPRRSNLAFDKRPPIEVMMEGMPGILQVRHYLAGQFAGQYA